mmetsp:Transcript_11798/g.17520  ORF Transcript_11798/g.17520 Transcript_11798/m.17520 type:complete len:122 (+) Transcript_11798:195-560(+)
MNGENIDDFSFSWEVNNNENNNLIDNVLGDFTMGTNENSFDTDNFDPSVADMVEQEMQMQNFLKTPATPKMETSPSPQMFTEDPLLQTFDNPNEQQARMMNNQQQIQQQQRQQQKKKKKNN